MGTAELSKVKIIRDNKPADKLKDTIVYAPAINNANICRNKDRLLD